MQIIGSADVDVIERNDLFSWGDESTIAILSIDGEPFGNMLSTRDGNLAPSLSFSLVFIRTIEK